MKILWINDRAELTGGCEQYIFQTVALLKKHAKIENQLLYGLSSGSNVSLLKAFDQAFPCVSPLDQIKQLNPDLIYLHRTPESLKLSDLEQLNIPVVQFFHDHKLFCLREHKYSTIKQQTCTQSIGLNCYQCLGFINRNGKGIELKTVYALKVKQRAHDFMAGYMVASKYMAQQLIADGFDANKITVNPLYSISNGQELTNIPRHAKKLLFVGQMVTGKGVDILLKALSICKSNPQLALIGDGRQMKKYQKLANKLNLQNQVQFLGQKKSSELAQYYKSSTALIFPSRAPETFGLVGIEAMKYSCPIIASDVGGIQEWLIEGQTGFLFPTGNVEALANKIDNILLNPHQALEMGVSAYYHWQQNFQAPPHLEKILKTFSNLVNKNYEVLVA